MDKGKKIRLRAPNFTRSESLHLCEVLEKYKHIIENKKTDGASLQDKQNAWLKVVEDYNSTTTTYSRTIESLQQCYKNLKKKIKKELSATKMSIPVDRELLVHSIEEHGDNWQSVSDSVGVSQETCQDIFQTMKKEAKKHEQDIKKDILCTGGGPSRQPKDDPLLDKVCSLAGPTMDGMYTIYDGDCVLMDTLGIAPVEIVNTCITLPSSSKDNADNSCITLPSSGNHNADNTGEEMFTNNRANLKRKPNPKLTVKKEKRIGSETVCDRFKTLAGEKLKLVTSHKELVSMQIQVESEKLLHMNMLTEMMRSQMCEQEEKLTHNRMLRSLEIEEYKKKAEHSELLRKLEIDLAKNH